MGPTIQFSLEILSELITDINIHDINDKDHFWNKKLFKHLVLIYMERNFNVMEKEKDQKKNVNTPNKYAISRI